MKSWPHWGQQKKSFWFHWVQDFTPRLSEIFSSSVVTGWGRREEVSAAGHGICYQLAIRCPHIFIFTSLSDEADSTLICSSVDLQCIFRYLWAKSIFLSRHVTPNISCWVTEVAYGELCNSGLTMWKFNLPTLLPRGNYLPTCTKLITIDFAIIITVLIKSR